MSTRNELPWIETGYELFALHGPEALKVEQIARQVGISKSSFYHHFADMPVFIERLLEHHAFRAEMMEKKAKHLENFSPGYLHLLVEHRSDVLFQKQLRIHRENIRFQYCYQRAHDLVVGAVMGLWAEEIGIPGQLTTARSLLTVIADVFYQRLTKDNLNYEWLVEMLQETGLLVAHVVHKEGGAPYRY